MQHRTFLIATLAALLVAGAVLAADQEMHWLNVKVDAVEDNARISVRVPLSLVSAVLGAVHTGEIRGGKISLGTADADIDWPSLLSALKEAPDAQYVKVESDDGTVDIVKQGRILRIDVREAEEEAGTVRVMLPTAVLDAVSIDEHNRLDLGALLASLDRDTVGDLVTVTAPEAVVRIWID